MGLFGKVGKIVTNESEIVSNNEREHKDFNIGAAIAKAVVSNNEREHNDLLYSRIEAVVKTLSNAVLEKKAASNSVCENEGLCESTTKAVPVAPTYQIHHSDPNQAIIDKYGYIPAAVQALQQNPMGLWYYDQQSSIFRSKFVDYIKLDNCHDQKAVKLYIERITRVMSMPKVYQMILQEMPELGTDINGNTIKFKIAGYNSTKIGLLAVKDDKHVLAIIYDNAEDKAQGISGDRKNVDAWIVKKLAD